MSAIILVAAYGLIELEDAAFMWKMKAWRDMAVMMLTFIITLFISVDLGILAGLGVSILLVIKNTTQAHITLMGNIPGTTKYADLEKDPNAKRLENIIIISVTDALYFSNIQKVKDMINRIEKLGSHNLHPGEDRIDFKLHGIVIFAKSIADVDCSALQILHEMMEGYHHRNVKMTFVRLPENLIGLFKKAGIIHGEVEETVFPSIHEAVTAIRQMEHSEVVPAHKDDTIQYSQSALGHRSTNTKRSFFKDMKKTPTKRDSQPEKRLSQPVQNGLDIEESGTTNDEGLIVVEEERKDEEIGFEDTIR